MSEVGGIVHDESATHRTVFVEPPQVIQQMNRLAELEREDAVLEIGAGLGPLTGQLLEASSRVRAVEKDARLVEILEEATAPSA